MMQARRIVFAVLIVLGLPLVGNAQPPVGSEFQVNTYTVNNQRTNAVCAAADGAFVFVWQSTGQDGALDGVFGQRYGSDGAPTGSEFQVNTYTANNQRHPRVACDDAGNFVVAWDSVGQDGNGYGVFARRFASTGAALGAEFQVNTYTPNDQSFPSVCADVDGDFVVAWRVAGNRDGDFLGVFAQRFDSSGASQGSEFQVNTYTLSDQSLPAVSCSDAGDFVIVWQSLGQDGSANANGIFGQRFASGGAFAGTEFQINTYTVGAQQAPAVASDGNGDFVVVWQSAGQDGSAPPDPGIFAQRFASDGAFQGTEFQVNTYTVSAQAAPAVGRSQAGEFVVVWQSTGQDGDGNGVFGQRFTSGGGFSGAEFQVNTYTATAQQAPVIAHDDVGGFVVGWESLNGQDGNLAGVFAQRYAPPTATPTPNPTATPTGLCAPAPRPSCHKVTVPEKSKLLLKDLSDDTKDKVLWKWVKGDATLTSEFGNPVMTTTYAFCIYDETGSVPSLKFSFIVPPGGTCFNGKPCWKATGTKGFKYKDKTLAHVAGLAKVVLRAGAAGKSKVIVKGKGSSLTLPSLPLTQDTAVIAQVVNTNDNICWDATFPSPAIKNRPDLFKDKGS